MQRRTNSVPMGTAPEERYKRKQDVSSGAALDKGLCGRGLYACIHICM